MKTRRLGLLAMSAATLAGCASTDSGYQPPKVDNTPTHTTAVIHATSRIEGSILPNFHGTETAYTRADRRTIDNESKVDSWWAKMMMDDLHTADMFRMDQNRAMKVNYNNQTYYECGISQCPSVINMLNAASNESADKGEDTYDPEGSEACPLQLVEHEFNVVDTGQSKTLHGYPAHLYQATWDLIYEDDNRQQNTNKLVIEFWTTPPTGEMKQIWAIHQKATDAYVEQADLDHNPLARFLPEDVFRAVSAFSGDTDSSTQQWHNEVTRKLATIQGYPLSIELDWYLEAHACEEAAPQTASSDSASDPLGALKDMASNVVGDAVKDQFAADEGAPIFSYRYDVQSASIAQVHDSVFNVPKGFREKPLPDWVRK